MHMRENMQPSFFLNLVPLIWFRVLARFCKCHGSICLHKLLKFQCVYAHVFIIHSLLMRIHRMYDLISRLLWINMDVQVCLWCVVVEFLEYTLSDGRAGSYGSYTSRCPSTNVFPTSIGTIVLYPSLSLFIWHYILLFVCVEPCLHTHILLSLE